MRTIYPFIMGLLLAPMLCLAQHADSMLQRPGQITFFFPLGTNGLEAPNCVNTVSINLISGYQGGLDGVEMAGFSNHLRSHMRGAQLAGFANTVGGNVYGAQLSGFANLAVGNTSGLQAAGFANISAGETKAWQAAGFANLAADGLWGVQGAGFANIAVGPVQGAQISGFANVATGRTAGYQAAGFANVVTDTLLGGQISGFANVARLVKGHQVSGFINVAQRVDGLQLGIVNISDTIGSGMAIGLINLSAKGYKAMEIKTHENLFVTAALKTGTTKFYNVFTLGMRPTKEALLFSYGYGVGTKLPLGKRLALDIEANSHQIVENHWRYDHFLMLNKLELSVSAKLMPQIELFVGPTFNQLWWWEHRSGEHPYAREIIKVPSWDYDWGRTQMSAYVGAQGGLRFSPSFN
ncbi:MAG: hypothetical protein HYZ16_09630 [Bacteroidetes bacterium]|nr:hypothetical protein [Bacteroidota bacterium]